MSKNAEKAALSRFAQPSEADRQQNKKAYRELTSSNKSKAKKGNFIINKKKSVGAPLDIIPLCGY